MYDVSTTIFSENNIFDNTRDEMKPFSEMFFSQNYVKFQFVVYTLHP